MDPFLSANSLSVTSQRWVDNAAVRDLLYSLTDEDGDESSDGKAQLLDRVQVIRGLVSSACSAVCNRG